METRDFQRAIRDLEEWAKQVRVVYMCAEALWWSCHRALVSDYLKQRAWVVWHIMDIGKAEEHRYTSPARIVDGELTYRKSSAPSLLSWSDPLKHRTAGAHPRKTMPRPEDVK